MQPILVPDYFGEANPPKDLSEQWWLFKEVFSTLIKHSSFHEEGGVYIDREAPSYFRELVEKDSSIGSLYTNYFRYKQRGGVNYVLGRDLTIALSQTSKEVNMKYLPKYFNGFIYTPPVFKTVYYGAFVTIGVKNTDYLSVTYLSRDTDPVKGVSMLVPGRMSTVIQDASWESTLKAVIGENKFRIGLQPEDMSYINTILQAVIYISNTDDELVEEVNALSKKRSKYDAQKKIYTSLPFVRVGFNFHLPKTFKVDSTLVSGHFRWQPYGPERAMVKHIYIEPHVRNYNVDHQNTSV